MARRSNIFEDNGRESAIWKIKYRRYGRLEFRQTCLCKKQHAIRMRCVIEPTCRNQLCVKSVCISILQAQRAGVSGRRRMLRSNSLGSLGERRRRQKKTLKSPNPGIGLAAGFYASSTPPGQHEAASHSEALVQVPICYTRVLLSCVLFYDQS